MAFVTLISRQGYLRQELDRDGRQIDHADPWDPVVWATPLSAKIAIRIGERDVWIRPWLYSLPGAGGYEVPVLLLDTQLEENHPSDRQITDRLYGGDLTYRLTQEIVLGIGGRRVLAALGFEIGTYHLNEGHAAFLALDMLRGFRREQAAMLPGEFAYDASLVRERCVFTTHTPVEAGTDRFSYELIDRYLNGFMDLDEIRQIAGANELNMTRVALNLSSYVNGVAKRHAETTDRIFPGYRVRAITNGVHPVTWTSPSLTRVYDSHFPGWNIEPEILVRADQLPDEIVRTAHQVSKRALLATVEARTGKRLDEELPIIGFARRMTGYKRPDLLFADLDRLRSLHAEYPFQVVMAGKAHPNDTEGKRTIEAIHGYMSQLSDTMKMVFVPNYDMDLTRHLVSGVDIWLNTPLPPFEASGTSGMKAALNGVLNLSVLDGWWLEAWIEDVTGWAIGADGGPDTAQHHAEELYSTLERKVLRLYYRDPERWAWMMKQSISKVAHYFNTQRMMRRYASEAYIR